MDCAIDCTFDELTGSGNVATAASIADCSIAMLSGEKDALAKSFTAVLGQYDGVQTSDLE
jgi:hypothetical protein